MSSHSLCNYVTQNIQGLTDRLSHIGQDCHITVMCNVYPWRDANINIFLSINLPAPRVSDVHQKAWPVRGIHTIMANTFHTHDRSSSLMLSSSAVSFLVFLLSWSGMEKATREDCKIGNAV